MKGAPHWHDETDASLLDAAMAAAREIMSAIAGRLRAVDKADGSPVTDADLRAEDAIRAHLARSLPGVPVVGEERGGDAAALQPGAPFILVDPLDGTRDCLAGSPEFTVNIALIEAGRPVAGVMAAPALGRVFLGGRAGSWELAMTVAQDWRQAPRGRISVRAVPPKGPLALESRSHPDAVTENLMTRFGIGGRREVASSLKFALIAAGEGDLYLRAVRLSQWDIAAGDAVLTGAGGAVLRFDGGEVRYGHPADAGKAPPFVAIGDSGLRDVVGQLGTGAG